MVLFVMFSYIYTRKDIDTLRLFVKKKRKELKSTQEDLALNTGVGFRFMSN